MKTFQTIFILLIVNISFAQSFNYDVLSLKELETQFAHTFHHYTRTQPPGAKENEFLMTKEITFNNGKITISHVHLNHPSALKLGQSVDPFAVVTNSGKFGVFTFHINDIKINDDGHLSISTFRNGNDDTYISISLNKAMELTYYQAEGHKKGDVSQVFEIISPTNSFDRYYGKSIEQTGLKTWETTSILIPLDGDIIENGGGPELIALFEAYRKRYN